jgi:tight adherence protein B
MLFTVGAILGLLLLGAGAVAAALLLQQQVRRDMQRRINLVAAIPELRSVDAVGEWLKARSQSFDARLQRVFAVGAERIWGMKSRAPALIVMAIVAAAAAWVLLRMGLGFSPWVAIPGTGFAAFFMPRFVLMHQRRKTERLFTDLFPGAVDAIGRMLRAGLPISSAVRAVSAESPPPVNAVFAMIADQIAIGAPIEEALDVSSRHIGLPDFRFFTVAVVLQHSTGGNLAATLEILSDIIRKRRAVRLKSQATTAEIRVSAYVLGALPFLIIAVLALIQPGYLTPLFADPRGHLILMAAAALLLLAAVTMRQMMRSVSTL